MKEKLVDLLKGELDSLGVYIDSVKEEYEGKTKYLRVVLDGPEVIDIDKVVNATKIIDPIVEKANFIEGKYILDVYAKSKGDE